MQRPLCPAAGGVCLLCLLCFVLLAWAATERLAPDAILAQAGFSPSCTVADIDEDPDAGDGNWCNASANNVDTEARTSFPTPSGDPTVGADLQEFRWQVRESSVGCGTGTPTSRAELWENGASVRVGSENNVTSATGEVFSFTWNANEIGTADGSLVEVRIFNTAVGGAPAGRCAVDLGAVEWNVDFTPAGKTHIVTIQ